MVVLYHRLIKNAIGLDNNFFIRRVFPSLDCGGIPSTISALRKKLPGFHRLSARRFGTQRSSFLPSSIRPVYGCARIPNLDMRFCENRAADSVLGYYCALAKREDIPFRAQLDLPESLPVDEIDMCLVLSNLLENALEASLRTVPDRRQIRVTAYLHAERLLLIEVENAFDGEVMEKGGVFRSSKRKGNGVGIRSVRHIAEKTGGASTFTYQNGVFSVRVMLGG